MELGDGDQAGVVCGDLHHLNEGASRLSSPVQQVMAAALGAPATAAKAEKAEGVGDRIGLDFAHWRDVAVNVAGAAAMIASRGD